MDVGSLQPHREVFRSIEIDKILDMRTLRLCFFVVSSLLCTLYAADVTRDAKADEINKAMVQAMGGQDAWNAAHFVRYDFKVTAGGKQVVDRAHLWDKQAGRYRLEQKNKAGESEVVLFNMGTKQGTAFVNGTALE